jgi:peptidoglycan L-alanyl-D-glutamate endopeptidase CwlK
MPFKFGTASKKNMENIHPVLLDALHSAIALTPIDFKVICGHRDKETQNDHFEKGLSKVQWPYSEHNSVPSNAIDFIPLIDSKTVDWKDTHAFAVVAGVIMSCIIELGLTPRWGGDWDRDGSTRDQSFMDWGHIEVLT